MSDEKNQGGVWAEVTDLYDHDSWRLGPFPDAEAAFAWCDAHNAPQLRVAGPPPIAIADATDVGVWDLASAPGYDFAARMLALLNDPEATLASADVLAERYGAKSESEWRRLRQESMAIDQCWCRQLRTGHVPRIDAEKVAAYAATRLEKVRDLFCTEPHDGDLAELRCLICEGPVLCLFVEHEGFGDARHTYYTPARPEEIAVLDPGAYEAWAGQRAGFVLDGGHATLYRRVQIGYPGLDHRVLAT